MPLVDYRFIYATAVPLAKKWIVAQLIGKIEPIPP
jgi:hypothetical protein